MNRRVKVLICRHTPVASPQNMAIEIAISVTYSEHDADKARTSHRSVNGRFEKREHDNTWPNFLEQWYQFCRKRQARPPADMYHCSLSLR